jgi:1-deoxy-D-xylulose-5-phosphate synthase
MATLRQADGISPFLDPSESVHDAFAAGHACTAVSVAHGMARARALQGRGGHVVALVGDGALTGGLTFEGLNNVGGDDLPLVVVVNDNQMSISANVGAIPALLRTGAARSFFESMGFTYLGPVDGHDLDALIPALVEARRSQRPIVVHAVTQKGRGFPPAEADPRTRGHAMGPYEWRGGKLVRARPGLKTYSESFADALAEVMAVDERVVVVTPAMLEGSALTQLQERFPARVFDVGIAEQHAVTFSAGLASEGLRPVCVVYSTFLQRAVDQVIHDVCLPQLPVVFAVDRAGLVGADGATHQGAYDLSMLHSIPHLALAAPVWGEDLPPLLSTALAASGPTLLRFPRGTLPPPPSAELTAVAPVSGARWLRRVERAELTVWALGPLALAALEAVGESAWNVVDARYVKPLDLDALREAAGSGALLTVEEGAAGGMGAVVLEALAAEGLTCRVRCLTLPDAFVKHGDARVQRAALGLDAAGIRHAALALLEEG